MQTRGNDLCADYCERNAELIVVLTAISIVSERLAGRIAKLEAQPRPIIARGGKPHEQNVRTRPYGHRTS
jgi:hypothetical protein